MKRRRPGAESGRMMMKVQPCGTKASVLNAELKCATTVAGNADERVSRVCVS